MTVKKDRVLQKDRELPGRITPEKVLFSWVSASRPFKRRDREFWVTVITIATVAGLILFLVEGVMPVLLIISLVFLFYILTTVEPEKIEYKITNRGIKIGSKSTQWDLMRRYWFGSRLDSSLIIFEISAIPGRLEFVIDPKDKENIKKVLKDYVIEEEASSSYLDRTADWLAKKLPGNK